MSAAQARSMLSCALVSIAQPHGVALAAMCACVDPNRASMAPHLTSLAAPARIAHNTRAKTSGLVLSVKSAHAVRKAAPGLTLMATWSSAERGTPSRVLVKSVTRLGPVKSAKSVA